MSRSRRKNPYIAVVNTPDSKRDKRRANRCLRRLNTVLLQTTLDGDRLYMLREVSDIWEMSADGKRRFDPDREPKLMRK